MVSRAQQSTAQRATAHEQFLKVNERLDGVLEKVYLLQIILSPGHGKTQQTFCSVSASEQYGDWHSQTEARTA